MKNIVMGLTGASGAPYALRLIRAIVRSGAHLHLVASPYGRQVLAGETALTRWSEEALVGGNAPNLTLYSFRNLAARIASGSFRTDGMVICPCSSNTLAAVANGHADNLITRAALVTLKEARRLILVPREMPLQQIEIGNMLRLSQSGAIICPASPGFYMRPTCVEDLLDFVVGRILDLLDLPHELDIRWDPSRSAATADDLPDAEF